MGGFKAGELIPAGQIKPGLRERQRQEKLDRIAKAAERLFARDGYEGATLRAIASKADVALATLSYYARDKRDLILLILNRLLPPLIAQGMAKVPDNGPVAERLIALFGPTYRAYAVKVTLYRIVLGHIYGDPASTHAAETARIRAQFIDLMSDIIDASVKSGDCAAGIDAKAHARTFYYLNFAAVRVWLEEDNPVPDEGLADLLRLFEHHVAGMR